FFYYTIRHPSTSTLFPYTTLFRSRLELLGKLILLLGRGAAPVAPHRERSHPGCVEIRHELRLDELLDLGRIACLELLVAADRRRSEEHTSELQSRGHLVCRLLLEK